MRRSALTNQPFRSIRLFRSIPDLTCSASLNSLINVIIPIFILTAMGCIDRPEPTMDPDARSDVLDREYRELTHEYNEETGARQISPEQLRKWMREDPASLVLLDIRESREHAVSALSGARHVPPSRVGKVSIEVTAETRIVTYCTAGYRSGKAAVTLEPLLGHPVYNLDGGIIAWFNEGGEVRDPSGRPVDEIHPFGATWAKYVHKRGAMKNNANP